MIDNYYESIVCDNFTDLVKFCKACSGGLENPWPMALRRGPGNLLTVHPWWGLRG